MAMNTFDVYGAMQGRQPTGGGMGGARSPESELAQLLATLMDRMGSRDDELYQRRQRESDLDRDRQRAGESGGMSETQKAYVMSRPSASGSMHALATTSMVNRNRQLRQWGYDPNSQYAKRAGPQRDDETEAEYRARVSEAKRVFEEENDARRKRNREQRQQQVASGKPWSMGSVKQTPQGFESRAQTAGGMQQATAPTADMARSRLERDLAAMLAGM